ncbi:hypothetical protein STAS_09364 [Striga asiatica]|uniref:Uncharacterized protein n=1 Tax=Striga asiatica TaxID=4170 RepID=A0A5A7PK46_STRAF|nr:hypothetical protein STAS_09364 [Striga asiatica]
MAKLPADSQMSPGIDPVNSLFLISKTARFRKRPSSCGILVARWFHDRFRYLTLDSAGKGSGPRRLLLDRSNIWSVSKALPLESGGRIAPVRLFLERSISSSFISNKPSGMLPLRLFPLNRITDKL